MAHRLLRVLRRRVLLRPNPEHRPQLVRRCSLAARSIAPPRQRPSLVLRRRLIQFRRPHPPSVLPAQPQAGGHYIGSCSGLLDALRRTARPARSEVISPLVDARWRCSVQQRRPHQEVQHLPHRRRCRRCCGPFRTMQRWCRASRPQMSLAVDQVCRLRRAVPPRCRNRVDPIRRMLRARRTGMLR